MPVITGSRFYFHGQHIGAVTQLGGGLSLTCDQQKTTEYGQGHCNAETPIPWNNSPLGKNPTAKLGTKPGTCL